VAVDVRPSPASGKERWGKHSVKGSRAQRMQRAFRHVLHVLIRRLRRFEDQKRAAHESPRLRRPTRRA